MARTKVLFLCTGNSCRSQMTEGWARVLHADTVEPYSAGLIAAGLSPDAVRVMAEAGVDISAQTSNTIQQLLDVPFDLVVTVCAHAHVTCPVFPSGARVVHHGFDDPPSLSVQAPTEQQRLASFRRVRDEIKSFIHDLPRSL